jgi:hypothetical protein
MQVTSRGFRAWRVRPMSQRQRPSRQIALQLPARCRQHIRSMCERGQRDSNRMKRDLAIRALDMAVALRQPP